MKWFVFFLGCFIAGQVFAGDRIEKKYRTPKGAD